MIDTLTSGPGYYYKTRWGHRLSLQGLLLLALCLLFEDADHRLLRRSTAPTQRGLANETKGAPVTQRDLSSPDHSAIAKHSRLERVSINHSGKPQ